MIDTSVFMKRRITCPEELTQMWVAAFIRHIGIDTHNRTIKEVRQDFKEIYAAYLKASPRSRPANEQQYDHSYNYHHNVEALNKCMDMLQELHCWLMS